MSLFNLCSIQKIISLIESTCLYRHWTLVSFSADTEFIHKRIWNLLSTHDIKMKDRPVQRHTKTGILKRKTCTSNAILERLQKDSIRSSDSFILNRATFLSNMCSVSSTLSSFKLVRGYKPALRGHLSKMVSTELPEANKKPISHQISEPPNDLKGTTISIHQRLV